MILFRNKINKKIFYFLNYLDSYKKFLALKFEFYLKISKRMILKNQATKSL